MGQWWYFQSHGTMEITSETHDDGDIDFWMGRWKHQHS